jgi:anti-sigma-K factor RskA
MVASLAAAFYFGYWTLRLQGDAAATQARLAQQEAVVRAAVQGRVVQLTSTNVAPQVRGAVAESPTGTVVYLDGLPQPPADRAYEVWLIPPGGQPVGVGLSSAGQGGTQTIPIDRGLAGMQSLAITEEPAGGSPGPTTQILAAARL